MSHLIDATADASCPQTRVGRRLSPACVAAALQSCTPKRETSLCACRLCGVGTETVQAGAAVRVEAAMATGCLPQRLCDCGKHVTAICDWHCAAAGERPALGVMLLYVQAMSGGNSRSKTHLRNMSGEKPLPSCIGAALPSLLSSSPPRLGCRGVAPPRPSLAAAPKGSGVPGRCQAGGWPAAASLSDSGAADGHEDAMEDDAGLSGLKLKRRRGQRSMGLAAASGGAAFSVRQSPRDGGTCGNCASGSGFSVSIYCAEGVTRKESALQWLLSS